MKQLKRKDDIPQDIEFIEELSEKALEKLYIGVFYPAGEYKGFITRAGYNSGDYIIASPHRITIGNFMWLGPAKDSPTLKGLIEMALNTDKVYVFVFRTFQELFKWISEDDTSTLK